MFQPFFTIIRFKADTHNARILISMNACTQISPLAIDGNVATTKSTTLLNPGKFAPTEIESEALLRLLYHYATYFNLAPKQQS